MENRLFRLLISISLISFVCHVQAQSNSLPNLEFQIYTSEEGLTDNSVYNIFQDSHGFIWMATDAGANRFDGYSFEQFKVDTRTTNSISSNVVSSFCEDGDGNIWIGTRQKGIDRYNPRTGGFNNFRNNESVAGSLSHNFVANCSYDSIHNCLLVSTSKGLNILDLNQDYTLDAAFHIVNVDSEHGVFQGDEVNVAKVDAKGNYWVGTKSALYHIEMHSVSPFEYTIKEVLPNYINDILFDSDGRVWVMSYGIYNVEFTDAKDVVVTPFKITDQLGNNLNISGVEKLAMDFKGVLWLASASKGLFELKVNGNVGILKSHSFHVSSNGTSLSSNSIKTVFVDRTNNLWAGTFGGGVNRFDIEHKKFTKIKSSDSETGLVADVVRAIHEDSFGNLFVGTNNNGMSLLPANKRDGSFNHFVTIQPDNTNPNSLISNQVMSMEEIDVDGQRGMLFGNTGLCRLNLPLDDYSDLEFTNFKVTDFAGIYTPLDLFQDKSGNIWGAFYNGGIQRAIVEDGKITGFEQILNDPEDPSSLASNIGRSVVETGDGSIWVGTSKGLQKMLSGKNVGEPYQFKTFINDPEDSTSISNDYILPLFVSSKDELWIGTLGGGVNKYIPDEKGGHFKRYTEYEGLSNNTVKAILEDDLGNLWISTNEGISVLNPETNTIRTYYSNDGLSGNVFMDLSACKNKNGEMYFGSSTGVTFFHPNDIKDNPYEAIPIITDFKLFNKSVIPGHKYNRKVILDESILFQKELELTHKDNVIEFHFSSMHFASPEKNNYLYKLDGFDEDWVETSSDRRFASYTSLNPGSYAFRVKASNNDGLISEQEATILLKVNPPWWGTWLFRIFVLVVIVSLLTFYYKRRTSKLKAYQRKLEAEVRLATEEVKKRNERLEEAKTKIDNIMSEVKEELGKASVDLVDATTSQASTIEEISSSIDQMAQEINHNAVNAGQMYESAQAIEKETKLSVDIVEKTMHSITEITEGIGFISEFANITNLLSLNAAIEAARAGVHGRSFAVVASEVKKLADQSKETANNIKTVSESGLELSNQANEKIQDLQDYISTIVGLIASIRETSQSQSDQANTVNQAIQQISVYINSTVQLAAKLDGAINALTVEEE